MVHPVITAECVIEIHAPVLMASKGNSVKVLLETVMTTATITITATTIVTTATKTTIVLIMTMML